MSENLTGQVTINSQYVKDISFENPNSPIDLSKINSQPSIELNLDLSVKEFENNIYEVSIQVKSKASSDNIVLFAVDIIYSGLFTLTDVAEESKEQVLLIQCPTIIFPFLRRIIADVTRDGGFQPLMIDPVDFASLYSRKKQNDNSDNLTGMPQYN